MMYRPIEILLADDHEIFRDGFTLMVRKLPELKLVGEAADGRRLVELAVKLAPDVIITDIKMPVMTGLEATIELTRKCPQIGIIALSMYGEESHVMEMVRAGARGYLIKNAHKTEILDAIRTVFNDESYFSDDIQRILKSVSLGDPVHPPDTAEKPEFSDKEIAIIRLICQEYSYKEIASILKLSKRTIEWYCDGIIRRIHVRNRNGIIVYAIRNNIFQSHGSFS